MQNVSGHPQVVAGLDALTRSHLELPLRGHDLGVAAADLDERPAVSVQQAVLLLQAEPGHGLFGKVHDSLAVVSLVRF